MEDLYISPKGGACEDIMSGFFDLDGKIPCRVDGGLKCFGHPAQGRRNIIILGGGLAGPEIANFPADRKCMSSVMQKSREGLLKRSTKGRKQGRKYDLN